jgi:predicted dehydrogenase
MGRRRAIAVAQNSSAKLVCVADSDEPMAKKLAEELNCSYFLDYAQAICRNGVDVVAVELPNKFHTEVALKSMEEGKHVFCEKPMTVTSEDARLLVKTSLKTGTCLKVTSNVRYFNNIIKAKELLDSGILGKLLYMRGWIGHGGWNLKKGSWFTDPECIGGGTLLDNGCHLVDIARWFMGEVVECVGLKMDLLYNLSSLEDNAMAIMKTEENKPVFIQSSWTEWNGYLYFEVYGSKGALYVDNRGNSAKTTLKTQESERTFDYSNEPPISFKREVDAFVNSLSENKMLPPSGYDGLRVVEIINGLYESSKTRKWVNVKGDKLLEKEAREQYESLF